MKLQSKVTILLASVFVLYIAADFSIQRFIMYPSFVALERDEAVKDINRCCAAIESEVHHLSTLCWDWAAWDDSHDFARGKNPDYVTSNLTTSAEQWMETNLPLVLLFGTDGALLWGQLLDPGTLEPIESKMLPVGDWAPNHPLLQHASTDSVTEGLMATDLGPFVIASRPIVRNDSSGPIAGTLIMGRYLNDAAVATLNEQTRVDFESWQIDDPRRPDVVPALEPQIEASESLLQVSAFVQGIDNRPALQVRAEVPREISARGGAAVRFATMSLVGAGIAVLLLLLALLQRTIIRPVLTLTSHATDIGASSDLTTRLDLHREDELGTLATEFDNMVGKLSESRTRLVDVSRQAGMAEIASGVLHNVGNVLSNVTVITSSLATRARNSKVGNLQKVVDLIESNRDDLGTFLTEDAKGTQLIAYLAELTEHLVGDSQKMADDLEVLKSNIQHMSQVVNVQQAAASPAEVNEPTSLRELAESSLAVVEASYLRHDIEVVRELEDSPSVMIDRGKVLQVLVNLLTNAKEALKGVEDGQRRLTFRMQLVDGRARFEIVDSGTGIAPDLLTRIFAEGVTTKPGGNGFGLHYSALAAKEMGGSLEASSDGPGHGATFVLDLPVKPVARSAAA